MLNKFLQKKASEIKTSSKRYSNYVGKEFYLLNKLRIDDEKSLIRFHYISQYLPIFVKYICGEIDNDILTKVSEHVIKNIGKINCSDDIKNHMTDYLIKSGNIKVSYPNYSADTQIKKYDILKWKSALKDIIIRTRLYGNREKAIAYATRDWGDMDEKIDFEHWAKQQEQGINKLYRVALFDSAPRLQYIPGLNPTGERPGFEENIRSTVDEPIERIKQKVLSRLHSIKKILSTKDGPRILGSNYQRIMKSLLDLEADILGVKNASMIEDLILRTGNALDYIGCDDFVVSNIKKIAQMSLDEISLDSVDSVEKPKKEEKEIEPENENGREAIDEFVRRIRGYKSENMVPENIERKFDEIVDELKEKVATPQWVNTETNELKELEKVANKILATINILKYSNIKKGQAVQPVMAEPTIESKFEGDLPIDINKERPTKTPEPKLPIDKEIKKEIINNNSFENAFKNITISDAVNTLEALSKVFKNREIARQLSIIDLMLDQLGISGFFPSLAEATRSALESNQYCQSRVEDVLSRLLSAVGDDGESILAIKEKLSNEDKKKRDDNIIEKEMNQYLGEIGEEKRNPKEITEEIEKEVLPEKPIVAPKPAAQPAAQPPSMKAPVPSPTETITP